MKSGIGIGLIAAGLAITAFGFVLAVASPAGWVVLGVGALTMLIGNGICYKTLKDG